MVRPGRLVHLWSRQQDVTPVTAVTFAAAKTCASGCGPNSIYLESQLDALIQRGG